MMKTLKKSFILYFLTFFITSCGPSLKPEIIHKEIEHIAIPTNLKITDGNLSFSPVQGATSYLLICDNEEIDENTSNHFALNEKVSDGYHSLRVIAKNDEEKSYPSLMIEYFKDEYSNYISLSEMNYAKINEDNKIEIYGDDTFGQLGKSQSGSSFFDNHTFKQISLGSNFAVALDNDGYAYSWGGNEFGQLGRVNENNEIPAIISSEIKFERIFSGDFHVFGLTSDGKVYSWGRNDFGQTKNENSYVPTEISNSKIVDVYCGGDNSLLIDNIGHVYGFGNNLNRNISSTQIDFLSYELLSPKTVYKKGIVSDFGTILINKDDNLETLDGTVLSPNIKFSQIQSSGKLVVAKSYDNFVYLIKKADNQIVVQKYKNYQVASYSLNKNSIYMKFFDGSELQELIYE